MNLDNVLKALDYILDSEFNHYEECIENGENVDNHIYKIAVQAKTDLNLKFNFM